MTIVEVYEYSEDPPYRVLCVPSSADLMATTGRTHLMAPPRPDVCRHVAVPARSSQPIIEVELSTAPPSKTKPTRTILKTSSRKETPPDVGYSYCLVRDAIDRDTNVARTEAYHTSSRTGTLYFTFGSDMSPSYLKSNSDLVHKSSAQPIALGKLKGWQWMISACGVPNIVPLCESGNHKSRRLRTVEERQQDTVFVYGLLYDLHHEDEGRVDRAHGYDEHGPFNTDVDPVEIARRPFLQGDNVVNKLYQDVEVIEWFTNPTRKGISVSRDTMIVSCLVYVDESSRVARGGRICRPELDVLSNSVTRRRRQSLPHARPGDGSRA